MPYHVTWAHEREHTLADDEARMLTVTAATEIPAAVARLDACAATA
jgi:putative hydrolase of the HAD superfamily